MFSVFNLALFGMLQLDGALRRSRFGDCGGGHPSEFDQFWDIQATLREKCGYRRNWNRQAGSGESGVEPCPEDNRTAIANKLTTWCELASFSMSLE